MAKLPPKDVLLFLSVITDHITFSDIQKIAVLKICSFYKNFIFEEIGIESIRNQVTIDHNIVPIV